MLMGSENKNASSEVARHQLFCSYCFFFFWFGTIHSTVLLKAKKYLKNLFTPNENLYYRF